MKAVKYLSVLIALILLVNNIYCSKPPLMDWEFQFSVKNNQNNFVGNYPISIYSYDESTNNYIYLGGGSTESYGRWQEFNFIVNISGVSGDHSDAPLTIPYFTQYVVVIGSQFVRIVTVSNDDETFNYNTDTGALSVGGNHSVVSSGT